MVAPATARESLSRDHQGCPMFLHVIEATHLIGHRVFVQFNYGTVGEADLIESQTGSVFEPLRDIEYFRRFSINGHTLTLAERGQFRPECLHALVTSPAVGTGPPDDNPPRLRPPQDRIAVVLAETLGVRLSEAATYCVKPEWLVERRPAKTVRRRSALTHPTSFRPAAQAMQLYSRARGLVIDQDEPTRPGNAVSMGVDVINQPMLFAPAQPRGGHGGNVTVFNRRHRVRFRDRSEHPEPMVVLASNSRRISGTTSVPIPMIDWYGQSNAISVVDERNSDCDFHSSRSVSN